MINIKQNYLFYIELCAKPMIFGPFKECYPQTILFKIMYKQDLALNNHRGLICR